MQQLHLVGFTTEHDGLIYAARRGAKSGSYVVDLDDHLIETIEEVLRLRDGGGEEEDEEPSRDGQSRTVAPRQRPRPPRPESALTPREMQARLRSGRTIAQVAREAGVDEEWVERFAAPIFAEQYQVIQRAQRLVANKARAGDSSQDLGTSVIWNLADRGVRLYDDEYDKAWGAQHWRGTTWLIRFQYVNRKKAQLAEWELDLREGTLHPRNRLATELGYVEPGRRRKKLPPLPERVAKVESAPRARRAPARKTAAKKTATARVTARKPAARKTAAKRPAATRATAKKTSAKKTAAKKTAKKAPTKKAPAKKATAKKAPAKKVAAKKAPAKKAPAKKVAARKTVAKRAPARKPAAKKTTARKAVKKAPARTAPANGRPRTAVAKPPATSGLIVVPRAQPRSAPRAAPRRREPVVVEPVIDDEEQYDLDEELDDEEMELVDADEVALDEAPVRRGPSPLPPRRAAAAPVEVDDDDGDLDDDDDGDDDTWAGPGSDEPAPALTIRADLAAATASARQRATAPVESEVPAVAGRRRRLPFRR